MIGQRITNSVINRKGEPIALKNFTTSVRQVKSAFEKNKGEPISTERLRELWESLEKQGKLPSKGAEVLLDHLVKGTCLLEKNYVKLIEESPLGGFHLGLVAATNALARRRSGFAEVVKPIDQALAIGFKRNLTVLDLSQARGSLHSFLISLHVLAKNGRITRKEGSNYSMLSQALWGDPIDVYENIIFNRVLYLDDYLSITWYSPCVGRSKKFQAVGEVAVAVKASNDLWSFDKHADITIPIASLRRARAACQKWRGQSMQGQITHLEAKRLASFLGFTLDGDIAHLGRKSYGGFGCN